MQTYFMEYDCVKNQVLPSLKHEFIKVTDVMLNQNGGAGGNESNIMCIENVFALFELRDRIVFIIVLFVIKDLLLQRFENSPICSSTVPAYIKST